MDSSCSTPSSSRSRAAAASRLPHHLQQPSSSTTGPAVHSPSVHSVRPGQCYVTVQTLSKESLVIVVNQKTRVHDVLWKCGEILEIAEDKLFGLALRQPTEGIGNDQPRHEYFFLDPAQKIVKYAPKQPRFANWHNRSVENRPLLVLYFRVRVYIDNDRLISTRDPKALEQYYLQLKDNFLDQWSGSRSVSEERCWEMAALSLRADKGDNPGGYFRAEQYFPMWVIDVRGLEYIRRNMPSVMEDLKDTCRNEAMAKFCQEASRSPFALNCHLYGLRRHKMDTVDNVVLGINARGIETCDIGDDGERVPLRFLPWRKVTKFSFDRKKLSIVGSDGTKTSMYAQNENKARYLLDLCKSVHQTLLVFSHKSATIAPAPQPFAEKCVDRVSTSSNTGTPAEHDIDSLMHDSVCSSGERLQGSVSSKQRIRVKLDSNLELKIEKMELEKHLDIRQDRTASQSSKTSKTSERRDELDSPADEFPERRTASPPPESARPSSVDSASQTMDSGDSRQLDVNFNSKSADFHDPYNGILHYGQQFAEVQYPSSNGSRSDSVQQSHEAIPEVMMQSFHHDKGYTRSEDDADSTLRTTLPPASSLSLHDLRPSGSVQTSRHLDPLHDVTMVQRSVSPNGKPRWTTVGGMIPSEHQSVPLGLSTGQARSEPRIDSDLWTHPSVSAALLDSPSSANHGGRLFTKRTNSGASRFASSINRVRSMPAHYHVIGGYQRSSPSEDYPAAPTLQYAHSMSVSRPKAREPPSYDRAVSVNPQIQLQQTTHVAPPPTCPLPAETPGGQPSFPPASVTPTQFASNMEQAYYMDEEAISTDRLREFPLMHRLWRESHGLNHARRPSSCIDLTVDVGSPVSIMPQNGVIRTDYVLDSSIPVIQYGINRNNSNSHSSYAAYRNGVPPSNVILPPPPPYPSNRKAPLVM